MKIQNKLQFFFLALALTIFTGQELIHPIFHSHHETSSAYSRYQTGKPEELKRTEKSTRNVSVKLTCPICSSVTSKTAENADIQAELIGCEKSNYSQSAESFCFLSYIKAVSRAPPCV
jgi:hypothetical protein